MGIYQLLPNASSSKLKVVRPKPAKPEALRPPGLEAPHHMPAAEYTVIGESAARTTKWGKPHAEFDFRVLDEEFVGVCLPGWIEIKMHADKVRRGCRYYKYCTMMLGEDPSCEADFDPRIFVGKIMIVQARYALTNGKSKAKLDDTKLKGTWDYLRVGLILGLAEL
jgi:hypothetical protein